MIPDEPQKTPIGIEMRNNKFNIIMSRKGY